MRVMRELCLSGAECSTGLLARRTGLSQMAVRQSLAELAQTGIVEVLGQGRSLLYRLDARHALAGAISTLFTAERGRYEQIHIALQAAAKNWGEAVLAVWIFGSVARGEDDPRSDVDIAVLVKHHAIPGITDRIMQSVISLSETFSFRPSILTIDTDDLVRLAGTDDPWWQAVRRDALRVYGDAPEDAYRKLVQAGQAT